jgi:ribose transport system substrate-binding protein
MKAQTRSRTTRRFAKFISASLVLGLAVVGVLTVPAGARESRNPVFKTVPSQWDPAKKFSNVTVDTAEYKKPGPWTLAWIGVGPSNGYGLTEAAAVKYVAKHDKRIKKLLYAVDNNNPATQISALESFAAQKPDAIILSPAGAQLTAPIARVMRSGIPVILCENGIPGDDFVSLATIDLWNSGYQSADGLAQLLGGKGNVVMFNGFAGIDTTDTWQKAAKAAFAKYPNIKVLSQQFAQFSVALSQSQTTALLSKYPKIDGIWAGGGEHAMGAMLAIKRAKRSMPAFGVANVPNGFLRLAKANKVRFAAYPNPAAMSATCLRQAMKVLQGKPVKKFTNVTYMIPGAKPYSDASVGKRYVPGLSDDLSTPPNRIPLSWYRSQGLGRK